MEVCVESDVGVVSTMWWKKNLPYTEYHKVDTIEMELGVEEVTETDRLRWVGVKGVVTAIVKIFDRFDSGTMITGLKNCFSHDSRPNHSQLCIAKS